MQMQLSGRTIDVTPALRQYVTEKFERITRHFEHVIDVNVTLGVEKLRHCAEATIMLSHKTIHAEVEAADMYAAIDLLVDKLDSQVRKHKEKLTDHHRADAKQARQAL
jgi:putative sigma-54 modulation protein